MDKQALIDALRNTAQSASNAIAENVTFPVDTINAGLSKVGVNIPQPVGGAEWMQNNGFTRPVPEGAANTVGTTMGYLANMAPSQSAKIAELLAKIPR